MSSTDFFCFVEGVDNDRYVYSQLTSSIFKENGLKVEYPTANSLSQTVGHGGKGPLIKFFNFLNPSGSLTTNFKDKTTTIVFLLDKDVDDLRETSVRSKYVFYTEHYDLQNYFFLHGDVINAAAAVASIPVDDLLQTLGHQAAWLDNCTISWKEWVTICLFLQIMDISLGGYAESSRVNVGEYGPLDNALLDVYKAQAFKKSGLDKTTFDARYSEIEEAVDNMYASGKASRIFKGKWFLYWLVNHLASKHEAKVGHKNLACTLSSNLDWNGGWTKPYRAKMRRIVKDHLKN